jgi:hypothetical protein
MVKPQIRRIRMYRSKVTIVILVITVAALMGMSSLASPAVVPADAPADEFSAQRAMAHIRVIAQEPHPIGSPEHARVRDYIINQLEKMGLAPEVLETTALVTRGVNLRASMVQNIVVKIPGANPSKAILLDAHYDSMPMTPGASDCGSCVATLLETARALQAAPPLQNDVIMLFTDDEELDPLAGATAFVKEHPWIRDVGVALNFEGIGRTGPSIMFETGPDSGWLVQEWAKGASHPVAQSWLYEVYRLTPLNTDFTKYGEAGIHGLNFWHLFEGTVYHTMLDNPETIDPGSVQHHGSNALSLLRHLGNQDLNETRRTGDVVYFSLFSGLLVSYPVTWGIISAILAGLLLGGIAILSVRRGRLTIRGIVLGLLAFFLSIIAAAGLATGIWMGINQLHGEYQSMIASGRVYNGSLYLLAFVALSVTIASSLYVLFRRRVEVVELIFGALLLSWLMALASSLFLPGFSYLFIWPTLAGAIALAWVLWRKSPEEASWGREIVLLTGAVPGVFIITPTVVVMFQFGPMTMIGGTVFFVALLLGLLTPQLDLMTRKRPWRLPTAAALASLGFLVAGSLTTGFDADHPRPNGMAYILNTDTGQAAWFSPGTQTDAWTEQFFFTQPGHSALGELFPIAQSSRFPVLQGEAPFIPLDAPQLEIVDDQTAGGVRTLQLRLRSARQASIIALDIEPRAAVYNAAIDGWQLDTPESELDLWSLTHHTVPPEGVELILQVKPSQTLRLQVYDNSRELPDIPGRTFEPRSDDMMPMNNFDYGTLVVRTLEIP